MTKKLSDAELSGTIAAMIVAEARRARAEGKLANKDNVLKEMNERFGGDERLSEYVEMIHDTFPKLQSEKKAMSKKTYVNTPVTAGDVLTALKKMTPEELNYPLRFIVEPIHPRISFAINDFDPEDKHITVFGSLRTSLDHVPVVRTRDAD